MDRMTQRSQNVIGRTQTYCVVLKDCDSWRRKEFVVHVVQNQVARLENLAPMQARYLGACPDRGSGGPRRTDRCGEVVRFWDLQTQKIQMSPSADLLLESRIENVQDLFDQPTQKTIHDTQEMINEWQGQRRCLDPQRTKSDLKRWDPNL
jgi:hypothetical protein